MGRLSSTKKDSIVKVLITGWYGTETLGDRAILASLLQDLSWTDTEVDISISSIYPFFSLHTLSEDHEFYRDVMDIPEHVINRIKLVDARNPAELRRCILESDLIVVGGGPFDQIAQMDMLEYEFKLAKRKSIATLVYGCGINVLKDERYKKCLGGILKNADSIILRDAKSAELATRYASDKSVIDRLEIAIDPAVFAALAYLEAKKSHCKIGDDEYVAINLREYPKIYDTERDETDIDESAIQVLNGIGFDGKARFVPMHTFCTGGDDRLVGCKARRKVDFEMEVLNKPLNLMQTMKEYACAKACVGMRFHAVVFQTILNGNNYILNYTDSRYGKIPGFIDAVGGIDFYSTRSANLQSGDDSHITYSENRFSFDANRILGYREIYQKELRRIISK